MWADTDEQTQEAAGVAEYASWPGDLDIAVAGTVIGKETYAQAAAGEFDARWTKAARNIQAARGNSSGLTFVRPWHEFNGDWYWQVTDSNVKEYKAAFRRYVGILRKECPRCLIVWSPNDGSSSGSAAIADAYPGDDVVDVIAPDSYNANGNPVVVDDASWQKYANQREANGSPWGVETWRQFAQEHGKPLGFPEWGLNHRAGGGDNPAYIEHMNAWMTEHAARPGDTDLAGKVLYDVYFNVRHQGDDGFMIKGGSNVQSGQVYKSLHWGAQTTYATTQSSPTHTDTASASTSAEPTASPTPSSPTTPVSPTGQGTRSAAGVTAAAERHTDLAYVEGGGPAQKLDLALPERTGKPVPLVIFVHGGGFSGGDKGEAFGSEKFLARGFAVASVNYRLSGDAPFPAGVKDVKASIRWLRAHAGEFGIDPERFGIWGTSAGGYMAAMAGVSDSANGLDDPALGNAGVSSAVQAVVSMYGPTDFRTMNEQLQRSQCTGTPQDHDRRDSPESLWLGDPVQTSRLADAADLTKWVPSARTLPPFLFVHGKADCLVPAGQSGELAAAVQRAGGKADVVLVDGAGHGGNLDSAKLPDVVAFFTQRLSSPSTTSSEPTRTSSPEPTDATSSSPATTSTPTAVTTPTSTASPTPTASSPKAKPVKSSGS